MAWQNTLADPALRSSYVFGDQPYGNYWTEVDDNKVPPLPPLPDVPNFIQDCKAAVGGILGMPPALVPMALLLWDALNTGAWTDTQSLFAAAKANGALTAQQYATIQAAVTARNIPINLP